MTEGPGPGTMRSPHAAGQPGALLCPLTRADAEGEPHDTWTRDLVGVPLVVRPR